MASPNYPVDEVNVFSEFEDPERRAIIEQLVERHPDFREVYREAFFAIWFSDLCKLRDLSDITGVPKAGMVAKMAAERIATDVDFAGIWAGQKQADNGCCPQSPKKDETSSSHDQLREREEDSPSAHRPRMLPRRVHQCLERDMYQCVITGSMKPAIEATHIVPHKLHLRTPLWQFWTFLRFFWGKENTEKWQKSLNVDLSDSGMINTEQMSNLLTLDWYIRDCWDRAICALRPISKSADNKEIVIAFHWLPLPDETAKRSDPTSLLDHPYPEHRSGFTQVPGGRHRIALLHGDDARNLESGHIFTVRTENPETHPLPSMELLQLRWHLSRVASMQGGEEGKCSDLSDSDETPGYLTE